MNIIKAICRAGLCAALIVGQWGLTTSTTIGDEAFSKNIRAITEKHIDRGLQLYHDLLSFPNDTYYQDDIAKLVTFLDGQFKSRGFKTETLDTGGSPLLFATREAKGADKTVLVYLQADGQPTDPKLWFQQSPYTPVLKEQQADGSFKEIPWDSLKGTKNMDWRIFARSASDSKGPVTQFLTAISALDEAGLDVGYNLKIVVDTEEENGSPHLPSAVKTYKDKLSADMLLIYDGPPHSSNKPTLKFGARGIATITLKAYGPRVPQHSGHYGNYAPNPAFALTKMLGGMKDINGRVTLPGFYDGITITPEVQKILDAVPDNVEAIHKHLAIAKPDNVAKSLQLAVQYPSLNIRGLQSLKVGNEVRTLVPAEAIAEIDVRLVKESNPEHLISLVRDHIKGLGYHVIDREPTMEERMTIPHLVNFTSIISYKAYRTAFDSKPGLLTRSAYKKLYGEDPILIRTSGGSIPISPFVETLGIPAVGIPTVNIDNNQHAPNENIRLGNFIEGISIIMAVLLEKP
jgi:acetylornithine deacetylase/succinyl-diaminopimelate desuccinylase-like protein